MKELDITIHGETVEDLLLALEEVKRLVENECTLGFDENETGDYEFIVRSLEGGNNHE